MTAVAEGGRMHDRKSMVKADQGLPDRQHPGSAIVVNPDMSGSYTSR